MPFTTTIEIAGSRRTGHGSRWTMAVLAATLLLTSACVRRTISSSSSSILNPIARASHRIFGSKQSTQKQIPPDEVQRQTFERQATGAFDPLTSDRSIQLLQTRLRMDPGDIPARLQLAGIFERYKLSEKAMEQYKQALDLASPASTSSAGMSAQLAETAAAGLGRCAQDAGRASEAIPVLEEFIKRAPAAAIWEVLGILYDSGGSLPSGEQAFRNALASQPASEQFHNNLGYNLLLQKKLGEAAEEFRKALVVNPKSSAAHNNLGVVLAKRGDVEEALQQFRMGSGDMATAHNNLAVILMESGFYERSRDELVKALSARYYFLPPIENFKLVQELLLQRAALFADGTSLPLRATHIPPSLALAREPLGPPLEQDHPVSDK